MYLLSNFTRLSAVSTDQVSPIHVFSRCFNSFPLSRPKSNIPRAWKGRGKSTSPAQLARRALSVWLCNRYFFTKPLSFDTIKKVMICKLEVPEIQSKHVLSFGYLDDVYQLCQNLRWSPSVWALFEHFLRTFAHCYQKTTKQKCFFLYFSNLKPLIPYSGQEILLVKDW